ncbi:AAA family ATPase [Arenicellales bacterium nBUS_45]
MKNTAPLIRIVVTGSESTGKTHLTQRLAQIFDCTYSEEAARLYVEKHPRQLQVSDVVPIALSQISLQDKAIQNAKNIILHDTDLFSTVIYSKYYYQASPDWILEKARVQASDLYLLCDIDLPWQPEPLFRDQGSIEARRQVHTNFLDLIIKEQLNMRIIKGTGAKRTQMAIDIVEHFISEIKSTRL